MELGVAVDLGSVEPVRPQVDAASRLIEVAEANGISSVWLGESYHQQPESFHLPASLLTLAHLAARTDLPLGTAVLLARTYHPERLAYEAALVDQLCRGRLSVGIGLGGPDLVGRFGTEAASRPAGRWLEEFLLSLRAAWAPGVGGGRATAAVVPGPAQTGGPALLVGGRMPAAARRAARIGDGYYAATNYGDELLAERSETYWTTRGIDPTQARDDSSGTVAVTRLCLISPEPAQARQLADVYFGPVLDYYTRRRAWHDSGERSGPVLPLVGTPEEAIRTLRGYAAAGVTSVQLRVAPVGTPPEVSGRTLQLVGSAVLPGIQES